MEILVRYCPICFYKLKEWGEMPTTVFEQICEYYALTEEVMIIEEDIHALKGGYLMMIEFLEKKRYIITTECSDSQLAVLPYTIFKTDDGYRFCMFNHE